MANSGSAGVTFNHVGMMVPDMDAAISWYSLMFAAEVLDRWSNPEASMEWAHLSLGNLVIELVHMPGLAAQTTRTYALHHFALTVPDCDAFVAELAAKGANVARAPSDFERHAIRWAFVNDHLGNTIEIISPIAGASSAKA